MPTTTQVVLFDRKRTQALIAGHQQTIRDLRLVARAARRIRHHPRVDQYRKIVERAWLTIVGKQGFSGRGFLLDVERALIRIWEHSQGKNTGDLFGLLEEELIVNRGWFDSLMGAVREANYGHRPTESWWYDPGTADSKEAPITFNVMMNRFWSDAELQAFMFAWIRIYHSEAHSGLRWPTAIRTETWYHGRTYFSRFWRCYRIMGRLRS